MSQLAKGFRSWCWRDLPLDDLLSLSFEDASAAWRGPEPVAMVVRTDTAAGAVRQVHFMAPDGGVHWGVGPLLTSKGAGIATPEARAAVAQGLSQALRRSAVPVSQRRLEWLRTLRAVGGKPLPSRVQSLCSGPPAYREVGRVISVVVFQHEWEDFTREQDALLAEAGALAFLGCDERAVMAGADDPTSLRMALFRGFSPIEFSSRHELYFELNHALLRTFQRELEDLGDGGEFSFQVEASVLANSAVNLRLPLQGSWELEQEPLLRELLACRARFLRLLGWPMHLPSVFAALQGVEDIVPSLRARRVIEPFDAVAELETYVSNMASRFPRMHARYQELWSPL